MNITVGIDKVSDLMPLIEIGVNEFFCGIVGNDKDKLYGHRPNNNQFNLNSIDELKKVIKIVHDHHKKIFLVLNETRFSYQQADIVIKRVQALDQLHLDAFITDNLSLIYLCHEHHIKTPIHLSSLAIVLNSESVKFFQELGVKRIIFPHQISPLEAKSIIDNVPGVETEFFFQQYNDCPNTDGICRYHHAGFYTLKDSTVVGRCSVQPKVFSDNKSSRFTANIQTQIWHPQPIDYFGNLYDFWKIGIKQTKLPTRGININQKIELIKYLFSLLNLLDENLTKAKFIAAANKIKENHPRAIIFLP